MFVGKCLSLHSEHGSTQETSHRGLSSYSSVNIQTTTTREYETRQVNMELLETFYLLIYFIFRSEVDAAMWLDPVMSRLISDDQVPDSCPPQLQATVVDSVTGDQRQGVISSRMMTNTAPDTGDDVERASTGTRYAVSQWLVRHES